MIYPRIERVTNGQVLSLGLINGMIKRTEYAADLLQRYKCLAGVNISVEQKYDGSNISASVNQILFDPIPDDLILPIDPPLLACEGSIPWTINNLRFVGPYSPPMKGYMVSQAIWKKDCLLDVALSPKATYSMNADDGGSFGEATLPTVPAPNTPTVTATGTTVAKKSSFSEDTFFMWVEWEVFDLFQGGFGLTGSGVFKLN